MKPLVDFDKLLADDEYRKLVRRRCQTDLLFLGRVLGYAKLLDRVHGPAAEMCVQKNPDKPLENQDTIKEFLQLDPRGIYKTTLKIIDNVQWVICFPNVRICKLTATKPLSKAVANEIRNHFVKAPHSEGTVFQKLFPEFVISDRDKKDGEYTAPCRTVEWKEQTLMSFSIETTISGWHFDVLDVDDVVDTQNSATAQGIAKIKKNFRVNKKTLMPWGYTNYSGTRYNPFDLWGDILDKQKPGKIRILVRAALKTKSGKRLEPGEFPKQEDVELLFPELLSYEFLKNEFEDDFGSFMSQYMNDSQGGNEVVFDREVMMRAVVPAEQISAEGEVLIAWRFSVYGKPGMDHVAGVVGVLNSGRLAVIDAVRGKFKPSTLAHKVVQLAKKHGCHKVSIEETPGAKYIEPAIRNYALMLNFHLELNWLEYQEDDGARDQRIKAVEPMMTAMRVIFSPEMDALPEVSKQFCNYGMMDEAELPDVVSRLADKLPKLISPAESSSEQEAAWNLAQQRDMYDRTHGIGRYAPTDPPPPTEHYNPQENSYGLDHMLGGLNG